MEESILISIKLLLGISEDDDAFDTQLIMHINTVLSILTQIGVGPAEGFMIEDEDTSWEDFIPNAANYSAVKTYMGHKVRLLFDPPTSSSVADAINNAIKELDRKSVV